MSIAESTPLAPDGAITTSAAVPFSLVIPLYNEARRFPANAPAIAAFMTNQQTGSELVLVDDGSDDDTAELVEAFIADHPRLDIRLVRIAHRGKGAAVEAGLRAVRADYAAFCDVDLATPLDDLVRLVDEAHRRGVIAIGSRDLPESQIERHESAPREMLGKAYNRVVQSLLVPGVVDTQCGAKAASAAAWDRVVPHCRERGFAWDVELLAMARRVGVAISEVPVAWAHDPDSRVRVVRDGIAMVSALGRIRRRVGGVTAAAGILEGGGVFADQNAEALAASDADHWWFRGKAEIVSSVLPRPAGDGLLVDLGAGSGGVTAMLDWPKELKLAVDGSDQLVEIARERHGLPATAADVSSVPLPDGAARVVCLLDVIEHLTDPSPALTEAFRLLGPGGTLVVTVPAHQWLWSAADEALGHARRYNRRLLRAQVEEAGFEAQNVSHVFSWLVPPVWLKRRVRDQGQPQLGLDVSSPAIDRAASFLTRAERAVIARLPLPLGTSVVCVARRR